MRQGRLAVWWETSELRKAHESKQAIENGLSNQEGIISVQVNLLAEKAVIVADPDLWTPEKLASVSYTSSYSAQ